MCAASLTIVEIFGCVSSSRICTRVRMGLNLVFRSLTVRSICCMVLRVWKKSAVRIITCTISAIATIVMTQISMHAPPAPVQEQNHPARTSWLRLGCLAPVRFARALNRGRNRILLARRNVLAALDQFVGAFAKFASFALRVVLAFIGLFRQKFARFLAGFRREQNSDQGSNAQAHKKERYLGTYIIRH